MVALFSLAGLAEAQGVRLDARTNGSRLGTRLNQERLTASEAKIETEKQNQKLSNAKVKEAPKQVSGKSERAIRREKFDALKKKKRIDIDRD